MTQVALTSGCPAGVGPEVTARAVLALPAELEVELVFFGAPSVLLRGARHAGIAADARGDRVTLGERHVRCAGGDGWQGPPGAPDAAALAVQRASLESALAAAAAGEVHALYTAPIRKAALDGIDGQSWPGHTELLGARLGTGHEVTMLFAGGPFLLALATVHVPLRQVADLVTSARIHQRLEHLADMHRMLGTLGGASASAGAGVEEGPARLTVLGLNPHAGEGGRLGTEERDVIAPALAAWQREGFVAEGPVPADGFFAELGRGRAAPAGVVAMAHDQGLAPYKLLAEGSAVNLTAGLSLLRTSPDHGTADAIAGQGCADARSAERALELAARAAKHQAV